MAQALRGSRNARHGTAPAPTRPPVGALTSPGRPARLPVRAMALIDNPDATGILSQTGLDPAGPARRPGTARRPRAVPLAGEVAGQTGGTPWRRRVNSRSLPAAAVSRRES